MQLKRILLFFVPILFFALVISVNFFKPFGFFRESNPAMVCINYTYWQNNPTLKNQRIPIENFHFNPAARPETQMWNTVTSFGYAWFLVPYYFFTGLQIQANEITIRLFSLLWLGFTVFTIYLLLKNITKNIHNSKWIVYLTIIFYLFNSSVLWYHIQGYVHEIAVLPFYFLSWLFFLKLIETTQIKWLTALAICLFISVQFDWLPCFQAAIMCVYLLVNIQKNKRKFDFLIPGISILLGIGWIIFTYSQWATFPVYFDFLKEKFLSRTIGGGGLQVVTVLNYNFNIIIFYATAYGLLCLLFIYGLGKLKKPLVIWLMITAAVVHHVTFWGFSTEHDHAVIKMAFPICFIAACIVANFSQYKRMITVAIILLVNIGFYFYIHNYYTRDGIYANPNFCYDVGSYIKNNLSEKDVPVFINTQGKFLTQLEFYAGRSYVPVSSFEQAKQILQVEFTNKVAYYIDGEEKGIPKIIKFTN